MARPTVQRRLDSFEFGSTPLVSRRGRKRSIHPLLVDHDDEPRPRSRALLPSRRRAERYAAENARRAERMAADRPHSLTSRLHTSNCDRPVEQFDTDGVTCRRCRELEDLLDATMAAVAKVLNRVAYAEEYLLIGRRLHVRAIEVARHVGLFHRAVREWTQQRSSAATLGANELTRELAEDIASRRRTAENALELEIAALHDLAVASHDALVVHRTPALRERIATAWPTEDIEAATALTYGEAQSLRAILDAIRDVDDIDRRS